MIRIPNDPASVITHTSKTPFDRKPLLARFQESGNDDRWGEIVAVMAPGLIINLGQTRSSYASTRETQPPPHALSRANMKRDINVFVSRRPIERSLPCRCRQASHQRCQPARDSARAAASPLPLPRVVFCLVSSALLGRTVPGLLTCTCSFPIRQAYIVVVRAKGAPNGQ